MKQNYVSMKFSVVAIYIYNAGLISVVWNFCLILIIFILWDSSYLSRYTISLKFDEESYSIGTCNTSVKVMPYLVEVIFIPYTFNLHTKMGRNLIKYLVLGYVQHDST